MMVETFQPVTNPLGDLVIIVVGLPALPPVKAAFVSTHSISWPGLLTSTPALSRLLP